MKPTASVFRLKRAFKKLSSQEYADNLHEYLGDVRKKTNLTESDLEAILELLSNQDGHQQTTQQASAIRMNKLKIEVKSYKVFD